MRACGVVLGTVVSVVACGSDGRSEAGAGGGAGSGPTLAGTISVWNGPAPTPGDAPIADATVCLRGVSPPPCDTTDATGAFVLDAPPVHSDFGISIEAPGYLRTLILKKMLSDAIDGLNVRVVTSEVAAAKCAAAGGSCPLEGTGIVEVGVNAQVAGRWGPAATATVAMDPLAGVGPVYLGLDGYPDTQLAETSEVGSAMFVNVPPGDAKLSIALEGKQCVIRFDGFRGDEPGTVLLPAEPDTLTFMGVGCE